MDATRRLGKRSKHAVADERGERVGDAPVLEGHQREHRVLEPLELAAGVAGAPELAVLGDAAEPGVEHQRDAGLVQHRPERVELGMAGRNVPLAVGDGTGHGDQHAGAGLDGPRRLGGGPLGIGQRQHGSGVQATVAPVEAPVVVEPPVERLERGVQRRVRRA